jgi:hypothetical protein
LSVSRLPTSRSVLLACLFNIVSDLHRIRSSPILQIALPASTPHWGFLYPAGSKRTAGSALWKPTSASRPISFRSPKPDSILLMTAADQCSRFATSCEARCFHAAKDLSQLIVKLPYGSRVYPGSSARYPVATLMRSRTRRSIRIQLQCAGVRIVAVTLVML